MITSINPNNKLHAPENPQKEFIELLKKSGKVISVQKGISILNEGDQVNCIFFIEKGCFRTFRWINDEEVTIGFSFEGDIDTCPYAFINQLNSLDIIEALTDSKIIKIHRREIELLQRENSHFNGFIQTLLSHYIEILIKRNIDLRIKSADVLYKELYNRQPKEVAQIPLMYIASYLGISKERLSRIRKKFRTID